MTDNSRQLAFLALKDIHQGAFTDVALDRVLRQTSMSSNDRSLVTELVYGSVRRMRSLDALLDQLGKKTAVQQPPNLRTLLHLGLYQLRYMTRIPPSAAVNTTVELAKGNGFKGLTGVVNGLLRQYLRLQVEKDPLQLPENPVQRLGILHSFPDWIIQTWLDELGVEETEQLCQWMNQSPSIDLRINLLQTTLEEVETALTNAGVAVSRVPYLPQALRLNGSIGSIKDLPGFQSGWWTVQDSSAQLVGHLLNPQPRDVVIDACAAPGGKTTHIAEMIGDSGKVIAIDQTASRLRKLQENATRLHLQSIQIITGDSRTLSYNNIADSVLLDAPCSGLGTLHRRPDIRWRQTPENITKLSQLQRELLDQVATWVKPGGTLVYATCTIHPLENEGVVQPFLAANPHWQIVSPPDNFPAIFTTSNNSIKVWSHRYQMDGFYMVRLQRSY